MAQLKSGSFRIQYLATWAKFVSTAYNLGRFHQDWFYIAPDLNFLSLTCPEVGPFEFKEHLVGQNFGLIPLACDILKYLNIR